MPYSYKLCIHLTSKKIFFSKKTIQLPSNNTGPLSPKHYETTTKQQHRLSVLLSHCHNAQNPIPRPNLRPASPTLSAAKIARLGTRSTAPEPDGLLLELAQTAHGSEAVEEEIVSCEARPGAFLPRILDEWTDIEICVRWMDRL